MVSLQRRRTCFRLENAVDDARHRPQDRECPRGAMAGLTVFRIAPIVFLRRAPPDPEPDRKGGPRDKRGHIPEWLLVQVQ